jgi:hypothetical protein
LLGLAEDIRSLVFYFRLHLISLKLPRAASVSPTICSLSIYFYDRADDKLALIAREVGNKSS